MNTVSIEIKFKKVHPDAQLPSRKHLNREINAVEQATIDNVNIKLGKEKPELIKKGYRFQYRSEPGTNVLLGTGDTGYDLFSVEDKKVPAKGSAIVDVGIEVAYITPGYWFMICSRSGLGFKNGLMTHPGIVDNGYQGNCAVKLYNLSDVDYNITKGDRIAQIIVFPVIEPTCSWTENVIETNRGENGIGSTGNN